MIGGSSARSAARWSPSIAMPYDGIVTPGAEPAPGKASVATGVPAPASLTIRSARVRSASSGVATIRQNGTSPAARPSRYVSAVSCSAAEHQATAPQRTRQGVAGAPGHQVGPPRDHAGLRTAEQLVGTERHECGARREGLQCTWLAGQPRRRRAVQPRHRGVEQSAADVGHDRHAERRQLLDRGVLHESLDPVVARVHLQHQRHIAAGATDRPLVVRQARAVGGADVDQTRPRLLHHLGHPERAADLDRLAARHGDLAPGRQRRDGEQHRRRVVVDDDRVLGAAEAGEQLADRALARAALAGGEVELDGLRVGCLRVRDRGAAEVRVEQHARGVDHRRQQGAPEVVGARSSADPGSPAAIAARAMSTLIGCGNPTAAIERASASTEGGLLAALTGPSLRSAPVPLPIDLVRLDPDLPLPSYAHPGDAGLDLYAREDALIAAGGGRP